MKLITKTDELAEFCKPLADAQFVTVDTEFMRERTYWPKLCLAQVAGPHDAAAIDALAKDVKAWGDGYHEETDAMVTAARTKAERGVLLTLLFGMLLEGLPAAVVSRAEEVLAVLEKGEQSGAVTKLADDLPLFAVAEPEPPRAPSKLEAALQAVDPDALTPREALETLYRLKSLAD